ncbi:hypothetical protein ACWENA_17655 [Streptomyces sp. NPDC004779]
MRPAGHHHRVTQSERADHATPAGFRSVDILLITHEFEVPKSIRQPP